MPTVDYLPIANDPGANVESQAQYLTDVAPGGALEDGYTLGLVPSNRFNKTIRQSSVMAAALATLASIVLNSDILDDGDVPALTAKLEEAIAKIPFTQAGDYAQARPMQTKVREIYSAGDAQGATLDAKVANAILDGAQSIYIPAATYNTAASVFAVSPELAPVKLYGGGREKTIIEYEPLAYLPTNFGIWIGDHTNNIAGAYSCYYPEVSGLSVRCGQYAAGGVRSREVRGGYFSDIYIGALNPTIHPGRVPPGTNVNPFRGLLSESNINTTYDNFDIDVGNGHQDGTIKTTALDIHQSLTLNPDGGNTGVSTPSTTRINNFYLHHAADAAIVTSGLDVSFNHVIFEACARGINIGAGAVDIVEINDGYWEAIASYPVKLSGSNASERAGVCINKAFWNSTTATGSGVGGDTFISAVWASTIELHRMTLAAYPQDRLINTDGNTIKIVMDVVPTNVKLGAAPKACISGGVTTVLGSPDFEVISIAHGVLAGDMVAQQNFATGLSGVYNGINLNEPYYRVTEIVTADRYKAISVLRPDVVASANGTLAGGGTERFIRYPANSWVNCRISEPDKTILSDCAHEELLFNRFFAALDATPRDFYYENAGPASGGQRAYIVDDWTYILTAQALCDANFTGMAAKVLIDMPDGYATSFEICALPTLYSQVPYSINPQYNTAVAPMRGGFGIKVPPGTMIRFQSTAAGASNMQGRVRIARTRKMGQYAA